MARWPLPQLPPQTPGRAPGITRPKNNELSPATRSLIWQAHADGAGYKAIARRFEQMRDTVRTTVKTYLSKHDGISKPWSGRPKRLTVAQQHQLQDAARDTPSIAMRNLRQTHAPQACQCTVQRTLQTVGIKKHGKQKHPKLLPIHVIARLDWVSSSYFLK